MDQPDTVNFEELTGKCPLCGTGEYKSFRQYESAVLARCPVCRLVYVRFADTDQLPDQSGKHLKGQRYNDPDRFWRRIRKASWQIRQTMSKRHGERECLVDIGAAAGHTLIAAKGLGLNAIGIDVSRDAVATCKAKALQARQGSMTDTGLPDASCTYVILKHVLEHELDLSASLGEMNRIARPGGRIYVAVPNGNYWKTRLYRKRLDQLHHGHFLHFTQRTLAEALRRNGWLVRVNGKNGWNPMIGKGRTKPSVWALGMELVKQVVVGLPYRVGTLLHLNKEIVVIAEKPM